MSPRREREPTRAIPHRSRSVRVRACVVAIAVSWCAAQALAQPFLGLVVGTLALAAMLGPSFLRRRSAPFLACVGLVLTSLTGVAALLISGLVAGASALWLQLTVIAVLSGIVPLIFAATFGQGEPPGTAP